MRWTSVETRRIPSGKPGTRVTLRAMSDLAVQGAAHPWVIQAAQDVARGTRERDDFALASAMLGDVRRRMRYLADPINTELVKAPWVSIQESESTNERLAVMDCDDASTLLASMLGAVGIPSRFVVVATDPRRKGDWSHVYVKARLSDGRWLPLDPIVPQWGAGEEVPESALQEPRADFAGVGGFGMRDGVGCGLTMRKRSGVGSDFTDVVKSLSSTADSLIAAKYRPDVANPPRQIVRLDQGGLSDTAKLLLVGAAVVGAFVLFRTLRRGR